MLYILHKKTSVGRDKHCMLKHIAKVMIKVKEVRIGTLNSLLSLLTLILEEIFHIEANKDLFLLLL